LASRVESQGITIITGVGMPSRCLTVRRTPVLSHFSRAARRASRTESRAAFPAPAPTSIEMLFSSREESAAAGIGGTGSPAFTRS